MKQIQKKWVEKIIVLTIIICLLWAVDLPAKKRNHGVQLRILTTDGKTIRGELLRVNENSLLLMIPGYPTSINTAVDKIAKIRILNELKFLKYTGYFLLSSLALGAAVYPRNDSGESLFGPIWALFTAGTTAALGVTGIITGRDKLITVAGKSPVQVASILKKLDAKARFPVELSRDLPVPGELPPNIYSSSSRKFHISMIGGLFQSSAKRAFKEMYMGSTWTGVNAEKYRFDYNYPDLHFLTKVAVEVSVGKKLTLGAAVSPPIKHEISDVYDISTGDGEEYVSFFYIHSRYSAYHLTAAYIPFPADPFIRDVSLKIGAGVGLSSTRMEINVETWAASQGAGVTIAKTSASFILFAEVDYHIRPDWSIGVAADYKYIPCKFNAFSLTGYYGGGELDESGGSAIVNFPGNRVDFGGYGIGLKLAFHF